MELARLQEILNRVESLAELEKIDPVVASNLRNFVAKVDEYSQAMADQYELFFQRTFALPDQASGRKIASVVKVIRSIRAREGERTLLRYCRDLEILAEKIDESTGNADVGGEKRSLARLVYGLNVSPVAFYSAFDELIYPVIRSLESGEIGEAKAAARKAKSEIQKLLNRVNKVASRIVGSSSDGANRLLTKAQVAENALRRPERVLLFNMALLIVLLVLGATVLQYVSLLAFPLLVAFVLAAVVVVNALYLRSIGQLSEESLMALMKLALLNFFAPLARTPDRTRLDNRTDRDEG